MAKRKINKDRAHWSDSFFKYVPALQAYEEARLSGVNPRVPLKTEAEVFLQVNPGCPMTAVELVKDFMERA